MQGGNEPKDGALAPGTRRPLTLGAGPAAPEARNTGDRKHMG